MLVRLGAINILFLLLAGTVIGHTGWIDSEEPLEDTNVDTEPFERGLLDNYKSEGTRPLLDDYNGSFIPADEVYRRLESEMYAPLWEIAEHTEPSQNRTPGTQQPIVHPDDNDDPILQDEYNGLEEEVVSGSFDTIEDFKRHLFGTKTIETTTPGALNMTHSVITEQKFNVSDANANKLRPKTMLAIWITGISTISIIVTVVCCGRKISQKIKSLVNGKSATSEDDFLMEDVVTEGNKATIDNEDSNINHSNADQSSTSNS